jgi:hypothetical protein
MKVAQYEVLGWRFIKRFRPEGAFRTSVCVPKGHYESSSVRSAGNRKRGKMARVSAEGAGELSPGWSVAKP